MKSAKILSVLLIICMTLVACTSNDSIDYDKSNIEITEDWETIKKPSSTTEKLSALCRRYSIIKQLMKESF